MTFHLITGALMSLCALYVCLRCLLPLRVQGWIKLLACALVFLCAYKLQVSRILFPGMVIPEVGSGWLIVSGWAFAVIIIWVLLSLSWDICLLASWPFRRSATRRFASRSPRHHGKRVGLLFCGALILATFSTFQGIRVPPVKQVDIYIDNLPPALQGFRIVQLSDMHVSPLFRKEWTEGVVEQANALNPDLILLTGDMIDGSTRARSADVAPLAGLRARYGVYACLGNHEYYAGIEPWLKKFESLGIRMLVNAHTVLSVSSPVTTGGGDAQRDAAPASLVLGGVADPTGATRMGGEASDMTKTFAGSPATLRLLLSHQPRLAQEAAKHGVALQLSGHTHGGQLFPALLAVGRFNGGYLAGEYTVDGMQLYVSRGVGLWGGFPIRLGAPSEITEITLRPRAAAQAMSAR